MITVDSLLSKLVTLFPAELEKSVSGRDYRVLISLSKNVASPNFITENQSKLLLKIFTENKKVLTSLIEEVEEVLSAPTWSGPFRKVDTTKKVYTYTLPDDSLALCIEFAFSSELRKKVQEMNKHLTGLVNINNGKMYHVDLTEKNIVVVVESLQELGFEIEEKILNFYKTIKSWKKSEVENQFLLTNIAHDNFQKHITADLGINTAIDENIINDRSIRYQYFTEKSGKNAENLTEEIATRDNTRIWVDKKTHSLEEVFESLNTLKRFPVMVVFDSYDTAKNTENLKKISEILEKQNNADKVGIYFRLSSTDAGKEFNQFIKEKNYNCQLDADTKVVGVQSGKIPKFFLNSDWKPMSVISIDTVLRHSKTAVYASYCDLIITYTDNEPIFEHRTI